MEEIKIGTVAVEPLPTPGVQVFRALVTPEMAASWLADQLPNRTVKKANVTRWARDMQKGDWREPVQPIQFNDEGRLIDGQNRLNALVKSGTAAQVMWLAVGVSDDARLAIDLGRARTAADVLGITGTSGNRNRTASIARTWLNYHTMPHRPWIGAGGTPWSVFDVLEEINSDPGLYELASESAGKAQRASVGRTWFGATPHGCLRVAVARSSDCPEMWDEYETGLILGVGLTTGDPRLALRGSLIPSMVTGTWRQQAALLAAIKTWNAWVRGESLTKIYASSPKYLPMPEVA